MSGQYAVVEKGALKDDDVTFQNVSYDPTTASPRGKIPSSESTISYFSKLFIRHSSYVMIYSLKLVTNKIIVYLPKVCVY